MNEINNIDNVRGFLMKKGTVVFTVCAVLAFCGLAAAREYYVSPKGDDSNGGSKAAPFRTIQKCADVAVAGDVCRILPGAYREEVVVKNSGTKEQPIVFVGEDAKDYTQMNPRATVMGTEALDGWEKFTGKVPAGQTKGQVYRAKVDGKFEQLFFDGKMMIEARWPNSGYNPLKPTFATADGGSGTHLEDGDLAHEPGTWTGAIVHILPGAIWVSWTLEITEHTKGRLDFKEYMKDVTWAYIVNDHTMYYITRSMAALDAEGEWYLDENAGYVYFIAPGGVNPGDHKIEIKRRVNGFDLTGKKHVQVRGLDFFGCTVDMREATGCEVRGCRLKYLYHYLHTEGWMTHVWDSGIAVSGSGNAVQDCIIDWSAGNGVSLRGTHNRVENCLIRNVNYSAGDCGNIYMEGSSLEVTRNTMYNSGRSVLLHRRTDSSRITYNDMYNPGLLMHDLGATYTWGTDGKDTVIAYNWVHDNRAKTGVGIYIDNNSPNHIIHHNVCWNNKNSGIRLNTDAVNERVYHNTTFNNGDSINWWGETQDMTGTVIMNNIFHKPWRMLEGAKMENNAIYEDLVQIEFFYPDKGDFRLRSGSPCIDKGKVIPGISEKFAGKAPDLGAYEFEGEYWKPGCSLVYED